MEPVEKVTIAPPSPMASPMHRHTSFIIAITVTSILLVIAAVLAYLSWDNGLKLARENIQLLTTATTIQQQNQTLQTQLTEESNRPSVVPFYYTVPKSPFVGPTDLHAVDPITGEDTVVFTADGYYRVVAQPRREWDGKIFLNKIAEGDNPGYTLYLFDVNTGTELVPAAVQSKLPNSTTAMSLSPDERYFAAVYDVQGQADPREFAFLNIQTGEKTVLRTLGADQYFTDTYMDYGGIGEGYFVRWDDNACVKVGVFEATRNTAGAETKRLFVENPTFCLSDITN